MHTLIPPGEHGAARVEHFELDERTAACMASESRDWSIRAGRYARLYIRDELVMSDTWFERASNWQVVTHARGRILIGGLGLGMLLPPLLEAERVTHVTVVEVERDVLDLVQPAFAGQVAAGRLDLVHGDIRRWRPPRGVRYDTIYFDIWPTLSTANLPEMAALQRRFRYRLAPNGWLGSWQYAHLRRELRAGTRRW
jgi:spermidine synthase